MDASLRPERRNTKRILLAQPGLRLRVVSEQLILDSHPPFAQQVQYAYGLLVLHFCSSLSWDCPCYRPLSRLLLPTLHMADDVVGWVAGPTERGTLAIIWSCLGTIFACTWTVLHLNIPGYNDTKCEKFLRKVKWMVINILFPEFIFFKAVCDLRLALQDLGELDESIGESLKWTESNRFSDSGGTHEWIWEVEYPPHAPLLYKILRLKLPRTLEANKDKGNVPQPSSFSFFFFHLFLPFLFSKCTSKRLEQINSKHARSPCLFRETPAATFLD